MERLCERPGCSEEASVSYGLVAEDRVFWLDSHDGDVEQGVRMLCRRHADSMVVPIGWTLDDRRDPDLHLFRPPAAASTEKRRQPRRTATADGSEQLQLGGDPAPDPAVETTAADVEAWTPSFDTDDDLDGLLSAKSPLLARAFRGDVRSRR